MNEKQHRGDETRRKYRLRLAESARRASRIMREGPTGAAFEALALDLVDALPKDPARTAVDELAVRLRVTHAALRLLETAHKQLLSASRALTLGAAFERVAKARLAPEDRNEVANKLAGNNLDPTAAQALHDAVVQSVPTSEEYLSGLRTCINDCAQRAEAAHGRNLTATLAALATDGTPVPSGTAIVPGSAETN